jgi:hypothetical protein
VLLALLSVELTSIVAQLKGNFGENLDSLGMCPGFYLLDSWGSSGMGPFSFEDTEDLQLPAFPTMTLN